MKESCWQTKVNLPSRPFPPLTADGCFAGIGSCFAETVLRYFADLGLCCALNPCGIVYNLASMAASVHLLAEEQKFCANDFFEYESRWHGNLHHGSFSRLSVEEMIRNANDAFVQFRRVLSRSGVLIVTASSSVIYLEKKSGCVVANCHKRPNDFFERKLLSAEENFLFLRQLIADVRKIVPEIPVLLTLSPVRHYPGDLVLNSRSKAHLLTALWRAADELEGVCYFPAYEIVMDELRDYRFFDRDMLHVSPVAVELIRNRLVEFLFDGAGKKTLEAREKNWKQSRHRPLYPEGAEQ